jgi:hypothetical protein
LIPLINSAFAIETFLEGTRTDEERLAGMMRKGAILAAEDGAGKLLGCVYTEARGKHGYLGQLAVDPAHQCKGWVVKGHRRALRSQSLRAEAPGWFSVLAEIGPREAVVPAEVVFVKERPGHA